MRGTTLGQICLVKMHRGVALRWAMITDEYRKAGLTERAAASRDLKVADPVSALAASFRRHERILDGALLESGARLACREGCAYCCHFKVDVRADEALIIADFVRTRLDDATRATVVAAAEKWPD